VIGTAASAAGWPRKRLKFCATYNDEVLSEAIDDFKQIDYIEISDVSLVGGIEKTTTMLFHEAPSRARRKVRSGDVLISTVRTYLKAIAAVDAATDDLIASTGFCVIRPSDGLDARFAGWVAKSEEFVGEVVARSVGVSYPAINASQLVDLSIPLPPLETQKRIAAFLDEKTARIDALIAKKQALLERLAEKRQAIITQAVTKGLNPAAPMKDSSIDWLGQIPAHWEALPLRRIADRVVTGRTPPSAAGDYFTDGEVPWFTPGDFEGLLLSDAEKSLTWDAFSEGHAVLFSANSILLVGIGATLGKVAVAPMECSSNQQINAITVSQDATPVFLTYYLHAFRNEVRMSASGNTLPILNQDKTKSIMVTRPPLAEQVEIANSLRERDLEIERVATSIRRSIDLLRESRAALVTSAVTGQIEGLQ
jgi:type I restriction enzyme, S subunit